MSKISNSIYLSAAGDALGWITEFEKTNDGLKVKYGIDRIESYHPWEKRVGGRFNGYLDHMLPGAYSDDTQLMLSVSRSLCNDGSLDHEYFSKVELVNWLNYARGAGRTVKNASRKMARKSAKWNQNFFSFKVGKTVVDYRDSGANGAAMRILPIAIANRENIDRARIEIFKNSIATHGHPRAIIGALLYGLGAIKMFHCKDSSFVAEDYLTLVGQSFIEFATIDYDDSPWFKEWVKTWNEASTLNFIDSYNFYLQETLRSLRTVYIAIRDEKIDKEVLKNLGCFANETKGSGTATVLAGIYLAAKYFKKPKEGILAAVNALGSDTDSIASFCGGISGLLYQTDIVPDEYRSIQDSVYLDKVIQSLSIKEFESLRPQESIMHQNGQKTLDDLKDDRIAQRDLFYFHSLGQGVVTNIERQQPMVQRMENIIIDVQFEIGQSCRFSALLKKD